MEKTIKLFGIRKKTILCHTEIIGRNNSLIIMEPISIDDEIDIDNSVKKYGSLRYTCKNGNIINNKHIYLYGIVNLRDEADINYIKRFNLIDDNNFIPSNFDYDKGIFTTIEGKIKGSETTDALKWFLYNYVLIGKPKRIIIYKTKYLDNIKNTENDR